jgi:hypothetical protein
MKLLHRIAIVLTFLAIGACDNPSASYTGDIPQDGIVEYFPVSAGSWWTYETSFPSSLVEPINVHDTVYVAGIESNVARLRGPGSYEAEYRITGDVVTQIIALDGTLDSSAHVIRTPLSVGTQWQSYHNAHEIVAVDSTVDTPAGIFQDVVVVETHTCAGRALILCKTSYSIHTYYAKNVGLIKTTTRTGGSDIHPPQITRQLVSYSQ